MSFRKTAATLLLAIALAAIGAGAASAKAPPEGWGARDLQIAREYWHSPSAPLCATETAYFDQTPMTPLSDSWNGWATIPLAPRTNCVMYLRAGLGVFQQCRIAIHEYGHWLGLEHVDDPDSPMYSPAEFGGTWSFEPILCVRL